MVDPTVECVRSAGNTLLRVGGRKEIRQLALFIAILILLLGWPAPLVKASVNSDAIASLQDATIEEDNVDFTYGAVDNLTVTSYDRQNANHPARNSRALAMFDISAIPPGATIETADLHLWSQSQPPIQRIYDVHRLQNSWLEGTGQGDLNNAVLNGVTWLERQFGDNTWTGSGPWDWTSLGGDYSGAPTASATTPDADGWMSWNVISDVLAFFGGGIPNYGWIIRDSEENSKHSRAGGFASKETANPDIRPSLVVTYVRSGASLSTDTVTVGATTPVQVTFTNTGGSGGDQVHQVSFVVPAGWGHIPTTAGGFTIGAPAEKHWNVTGVPSAPDGPQTITVTATADADDLADGENLTATFDVRAPWVSGDTNWSFSSTGAAGGLNAPADRTIGTAAGNLDFQPGSDQSMNLVNLTGYDTSTTGTLGLMSVRDSRGSVSGWSVTVSAGNFINEAEPTQTIPASGFSVPVEPPVTVVDGSNPPSSAKGSLADSGLELLHASSGSGAGDYQVLPQLELLIPADAISGTYRTTITETIIGGL